MDRNLSILQLSAWHAKLISMYDQLVDRNGICAFSKLATSKPERLFVCLGGWLAGPSSLFLGDLTVADWHRQNAIVNKVHHSEKTEANE